MKLEHEKVVALVDKWRDRLGLGFEWSIGVKIYKNKEEATEDHQEDFANTSTEAAYFAADITFHEWRFDDKDDDFLDLVACHEVLHIVFNKTEKLVETSLGNKNADLARILNENTVELVSRALIKTQLNAEV